MTESHRPVSWTLWTLVTALGYSLGLYAGFFLLHFPLGPAVGAAALGACLGVFQRPVAQRVLEPRRSRMWSPADSALWVLAGVFGMILALAVGWIAADRVELEHGQVGMLALAGALTVGGASAGLIQERVLRRYVTGSRLWIPASALAWGASAAGLALLGRLGESMYDIFAILLAPALAGAIVGIITGGVLVRLPGRPPAQPPRQAPLTPP